MNRIDVALGERSYPVWIGQGILRQAKDVLRPFAREGRLVLVSDERVWSLFGQDLDLEVEFVPVLVPEGERAKSWPALEELLDHLLELGVERRDHVVALGGGSIGDVTGFAASILKRGCGYIHIPTTLLAQVDSSIGGKTAVNMRAGKNLVGSFHQPSMVLIDPTTLETLPERQVRAGYAEILKYGLIADPDFFAWCEAEGANLLAGDVDARLHAIQTSVRSKAAIVAADERETSGARALLNFGHTFGHALEAAMEYSDRLLHGEAVALGMMLAFRFSAERGVCPADDAERVERHLAGAGLPTRLQDAGIASSGAQLLNHMEHDKKREGGSLRLILTRGIGQAFVAHDVTPDELEAFLNRELAR